MSSAESFILFELADTTYGVRSADVLHIEMLEHITAVPNSTGALEGVVFSRGQVIPALNLRACFGLPRADRTPRNRLLFLRHENRTVALIVDAAREFHVLPPEVIRPVGDTLLAGNGNYVHAVANLPHRLVLLLDIAAVLAPAGAGAAPALATR
ncbi:chemotaxis protein CheW [Opitutus sp. ER46]|uniref:chemotaxis protein CheW n=1 Tax=Opitutus sp. ER46 TaxID=2161864 RepID=UPI000D3186CA|nr:chemotaxis protein CheW [Opitutus sp. ER46]PTX91190.1 chemotaxis protein CheW [Opitutus sp. ER46]